MVGRSGALKHISGPLDRGGEFSGHRWKIDIEKFDFEDSGGGFVMYPFLWPK